MKQIHKVSHLALFSLLFTGLIFLLPRLVTAIYASTRTFPLASSPQKPVAIVFGAGLLRDGNPTPVLRDRVKTAVDLYFSGKVKKLLMSGDNRYATYNEPGAMYEYAVRLGVPAEDIVQDFAGRRTYDTCYRAQHIFGVKEAVLVTQKFHLPRAIITCNRLGLSAVGVPADLRSYRSNLFWNIREIPATLVALWQIYITHPEPVLGLPEPIFSDNSH